MNYDTLADQGTITKTIEALKARNVHPYFVQTKDEALTQVKSLLPQRAEVMTGGSTTLEQIGFVDLLKTKQHPWVNLKDAILAETDEKKQTELRQRSVLSDYFLGSVHAIAETGEILVASASGSQIPAYAFTSSNIVWVVGAQKIVPSLEEGFRRIKEYVYPREDKRMKATGAAGTVIGKYFIFEREIMPNRTISLILVNEKLGF
ncbi:MAG: lactate utilization protein [bacterium]